MASLFHYIDQMVTNPGKYVRWNSSVYQSTLSSVITNIKAKKRTSNNKTISLNIRDKQQTVW